MQPRNASHPPKEGDDQKCNWVPELWPGEGSTWEGARFQTVRQSVLSRRRAVRANGSKLLGPIDEAPQDPDLEGFPSG